MRRKFVPPSYDNNKKPVEDIKELIEKGRKNLDGKNEFIKREKKYIKITNS